MNITPTSACLISGVFLGLLAPAAGQSRSQSKPDRRDSVTLKSGKVVTGRVLNPFSTGQLVVLIGGKRQRVRRAAIRGVHTIHDDLLEFFAHRERALQQPKRAWFLVEWAASKQLHGMARLQAHAVLLRDPEHQAAHRFLGHRQRGDAWLWPEGDRFTSLARFRARHAKWGSALVLEAEHFRVRTTAGMERAVAMLFDLELFYLFFRATLGGPLDLHEVMQPIEVHAWANLHGFPGISTRKLPYYDLRGDVAATHFRADAKRPEQLFGVTTQALLYAMLTGTRGSNTRSHFSAWAEIGLGLWMDAAFGGRPGRATPREKVELDNLVASAVLRSRPKLKHVTHYQHELFHELSPRVNIRWDASQALVHFLMTETSKPKRRPQFLQYLKGAFRKGLGDSSSAFDRAMGKDIEQLQEEFRRWLLVKN